MKKTRSQWVLPLLLALPVLVGLLLATVFCGDLLSRVCKLLVKFLVI